MRHASADADLISQAVQLGCLPPNHDRARHPGFFQLWADRALAVVASRYRRCLPDLIAEADRYSGQPLNLEIKDFERPFLARYT